RFKKTVFEQRADRIEALATQLQIPRAALDGVAPLPHAGAAPAPLVQPFADPDPFQEFTYPSALAAKRAIADALVMPLAKLPPEQPLACGGSLAQTRGKGEVLPYVPTHLHPLLRGS